MYGTSLIWPWRGYMDKDMDHSTYTAYMCKLTINTPIPYTLDNL